VFNRRLRRLRGAEDGDRFFELGQMSRRRSRPAHRVPRKAIDPDALVEEILKLS